MELHQVPVGAKFIPAPSATDISCGTVWVPKYPVFIMLQLNHVVNIKTGETHRIEPDQDETEVDGFRLHTHLPVIQVEI